MLTEQEALQIVQKHFPQGNIQAYIQYRDVYLFQIFRADEYEEEDDPFYSVHMASGEFRDFSIITDGDTTEIVSLFAEAKKT
jgi:hypothetical protein